MNKTDAHNVDVVCRWLAGAAGTDGAAISDEAAAKAAGRLLRTANIVRVHPQPELSADDLEHSLWVNRVREGTDDMPARNAFQVAPGVTFTREGLEKALDVHLAAKMINGWEPRPLALEEPGPPSARRWQWKVTLANNTPLYVCTPWELHALTCGLASAREAMGRPSVRAANIASDAGSNTGGRA